MKSQFWQSEIDRLSNRLLERSLDGRERVCFGEIADQGFPEIFVYLAKILATKYFGEETPYKLSHSSRYDFDSAEFRTASQTFQNEVLSKTLLSRTDLEKISLTAVNLEIDIIVRPRQKLQELLFSKKNPCRRDDALAIVRGFGERRAFVERLVTLLKNFADELVRSEDLSSLARKAEMSVYKETPVSTLLTEVLLYQKFEYCITAEDQPMIRSQILLDIVRTRELEDLFEDLNEQSAEKEYWTISEIESSLERHLLVGSLEKATSNAEKKMRLSDRFDLTGITIPKPKSPSRQRKERYEALQFNFLDDPEFESNNSAADAKEEELPEDLLNQLSGPEEESSNGNGNNEPKNDSGDTEDDTDTHFIDKIEPSDRKFIVQNVFSGEETQFRNFLERLSDVNEWTEAKRTIDYELRSRNLDDDSDEAVRLTDVLFAQFLARK